MIIRRASDAEVFAFYGFVPECKVWAAVEDGEIDSMGGFVVVDGCARVFGDVSDRLRANPVLFLKAARTIVAEAVATGLPVLSIVDEHTPRAEAFLARTGLEKMT